MKKLKLKNLKLDKNDLLQRNELKTVFGGYDPNDGGSGGCCMSNCSPTWYSCTNGNIGYGNLCVCNWNHQTLYNSLGNPACGGSC